MVSKLKPQEYNPTGPAVGDSRVLRGGAFVGEPRGLRSAGRGWFDPVDGGVGFRCAPWPTPVHS